MDNVTTRREIFGRAKKALAAAGIASQIGPAMAATPAHGNRNVEGEDYYDKLGVTKIINAAGTYTILTASTMPPSVQAAVVPDYHARLDGFLRRQNGVFAGLMRQAA